MDAKKCLVIYFSNSGNTRRLAMEISHSLNCDMEEIKTPVSYKGFRGYQKALFHILFNREPQIKSLRHNPADYDLIILGSPVWWGTLSAPVRTFLEAYKHNIRNIAFFITQSGSYGKAKVFSQLEKMSEKTSIANLAITERELSNDKYKHKVFSFISQFKKQNQAIDTKEFHQRMQSSDHSELATPLT